MSGECSGCGAQGGECYCADAASRPGPSTGKDDLEDWEREFTVWLVRRGSRFPMAVDTVFIVKELAEKRAMLLGKGEGWHVQRYSHLKPKPAGPAKEP